MGVSSQNIGLGAKVLGELLRSSAIVKSVAALKASLEERIRLNEGHRYPAGRERMEWALREFEKLNRRVLGVQTKRQMALMKRDYEKAFMQSRVLFMEILTARKDLVMGRGRTVETGQFSGFEEQFKEQGATVSRNWLQDKNEYWYDELGYFVFRDVSRCKGAN